MPHQQSKSLLTKLTSLLTKTNNLLYFFEQMLMVQNMGLDRAEVEKKHAGIVYDMSSFVLEISLNESLELAALG